MDVLLIPNHRWPWALLGWSGSRQWLRFLRGYVDKTGVWPNGATALHFPGQTSVVWNGWYSSSALLCRASLAAAMQPEATLSCYTFVAPHTSRVRIGCEDKSLAQRYCMAVTARPAPSP